MARLSGCVSPYQNTKTKLGQISTQNKCFNSKHTFLGSHYFGWGEMISVV